MKPLNEVVALAAAQNVQLRVNTAALSRVTDATVDGLFHVPLLALAILTVSSSRKGGVATGDIGSWSLATLTKHFEALKPSKSYLRWSVLLRQRCADALTFLEQAGLVVVVESTGRAVHTTLQGKDFLRRAGEGADEIGVLTRQIARACRMVEQAGLLLL